MKICLLLHLFPTSRQMRCICQNSTIDCGSELATLMTYFFCAARRSQENAKLCAQSIVTEDYKQHVHTLSTFFIETYRLLCSNNPLSSPWKDILAMDTSLFFQNANHLLARFFAHFLGVTRRSQTIRTAHACTSPRGKHVYRRGHVSTRKSTNSWRA